ncbi:MAG: MFS transporter [Chloroflexia bacterium]|nr:MFS transporter [Chloroflexia bacterium]
MRRPRFDGLWRNSDFLKLWAGQTVSVFGSLITGFALPLVAILTLQASPFQVALLGVAELAPGMLFGLFAGAWVDRLRRKPLMILADLGRAALLCSVPTAYAFDALGIAQLYVVGLLVSVLNVLFDVSYVSYLPSLVGRDSLIEGNSKLETTNSVAEVAGFGLAGILVQIFTAPWAILVDALTFLVSAASLSLIRAPEPPAGAVLIPEGGSTPLGAEPPRRVLREIAEGLRLVGNDRILRALAGATATTDFFAHIFVAVLLLFLTNDLGLEPAVFGLVFAVGGLSAFFGALFVERVTTRWGVGRTMLGSLTISVSSAFFIPLAFGPPPLAAGMLATAQAFDGTGMAYEINKVSLIQAITPPRMLGRVNASMRVMQQLAMLLGLLVGGALGQWIGLRQTVFVGVLGMLLALPWLYFSPIRSLREHPPAPVN